MLALKPEMSLDWNVKTATTAGIDQIRTRTGAVMENLTPNPATLQFGASKTGLEIPDQYLLNSLLVCLETWMQHVSNSVQ